MMLFKLAILFTVQLVVHGFFEWKNCVTLPDKVPAPKVIKAHGCEGKSDVVLSCPSGSLIAVTKAFFGHGNGYKATCDSSWITRNCRTKGVHNKVKFLCQNKQTCKIKPVESVLGKTSCWFGLDADLFIEYVCNTETVSDAISIQSMRLSPSPLTLPGKINTSISLLIKRSLPSTTKLKLRVEKKVLGAAWVSIPCVSNYGSCTYDNFCDLLRGVMFSKCDRDMENKGIACDCPIPTGLFTVPTQSITVTKEMIEKIPGFLNWLVNGKYRVTAEFLDVYDRVIGCVQVSVHVDINSKKRKRRALRNHYREFTFVSKRQK